MIEATCVEIIHNDKAIYKLKYIDGRYVELSANKLKDLIRSGEIVVQNIKLSDTNRLVEEPKGSTKIFIEKAFYKDNYISDMKLSNGDIYKIEDLFTAVEKHRIKVKGLRVIDNLMFITDSLGNLTNRAITITGQQIIVQKDGFYTYGTNGIELIKMKVR